ncbi:MAG: hypothetical protein H7122_19980 [Chitinophagaceae bacterium]|nr:hypothetical protein [Chitinophagaceae bacterium]
MYFLLIQKKIFLVLNINLLKKILNKFNGLLYSQEYLCLARESFTQPIHGYLTRNNTVIKDITKLHAFVGYSPLIFAFASGSISGDEVIEIIFSHEIDDATELLPEKNCLARLQMKKISQFTVPEGIIFIYEGVKGKHLFVNTFNQWITQIDNRLYNRKPGNVYLEKNLYKQVQIAYSFPRTISLISVSYNGEFNLFPTDLHGPVSEDHYLISLRHEGKACAQVEKAGQIVISTVQSHAFKEVYALGKNHMQELRSKDQFKFNEGISEKLRLPLPFQVIEYRELELTGSYQHGIHKILLFRMLNRANLSSEVHTLSHIHCSYGTWRLKHGLPGNYLIR